MQTKRHYWRTLVAAAALLAAAPAFATIINYEYQGSVASFDGSGSILPGNFAIGDDFSGMFSYDDAVSGTSSSVSGFYQQNGTTEFGASGGGVTFERGSWYRAQTTMVGDLLDKIEFTTFNPAHTGLVLSTSGQRISSMTMVFQDLTATALSSLALPAEINFDDWTSVTLRVQAATPNNTIDGHMMVNISRVTVPGGGIVVVPEPTTGVLFGAGLLALALRRFSASPQIV